MGNTILNRLADAAAVAAPLGAAAYARPAGTIQSIVKVGAEPFRALEQTVTKTIPMRGDNLTLAAGLGTAAVGVRNLVNVIKGNEDHWVAKFLGGTSQVVGGVALVAGGVAGHSPRALAVGGTAAVAGTLMNTISDVVPSTKYPYGNAVLQGAVTGATAVTMLCLTGDGLPTKECFNPRALLISAAAGASVFALSRAVGDRIFS